MLKSVYLAKGLRNLVMNFDSFELMNIFLDLRLALWNLQYDHTSQRMPFWLEMGMALPGQRGYRKSKQNDFRTSFQWWRHINYMILQTIQFNENPKYSHLINSSFSLTWKLRRSFINIQSTFVYVCLSFVCLFYWSVFYIYSEHKPDLWKLLHTFSNN